MNMTIETTLGPKLHCESFHKPSKAKATTDFPLEKGGTAESFTPPDLLAATLCSCMLSMLQYTAATRGININDAHASAYAVEENTTIKMIHVVINVPLPSSTEARGIIEKATEHCPVHKALEKSVNITTEWNWK